MNFYENAHIIMIVILQEHTHTHTRCTLSSLEWLPLVGAGSLEMGVWSGDKGGRKEPVYRPVVALQVTWLKNFGQ